MKIIIIGNGGTGKSTLGDELGKKLGLEVFHLDQLTFKTGWKRVDENVFSKMLENILKKDSWIVEGWSYNSTVRQRLEAAEIIIYLKFFIWSCYWGAFKRHIQYTFRQNPYDPPNSWIWKKTIRMIKAMWKVYKDYEPELQKILPEFAVKTITFNKRSELNKSIPHLTERLKNFKQTLKITDEIRKN
jgi:adenylate kinase family enzyme